MLSNKKFYYSTDIFQCSTSLCLFCCRLKLDGVIYWTVFFPDRGTAALPHFFRKCCTIISPRGPKGAKKEKTIRKRTLTYVRVPTFPYNIGQNLIGYGIFRKHLSLSKKVLGIYCNSHL